MHSYFNLIIPLVIFVVFIKYSKTTLSLDVKPSKEVFKLCDYANSSCINDALTQRFLIFNSEINQSITVKLGKLKGNLSKSEKLERFTSKIYTERRGYLPPSNSNEITINSICEFSYESEEMSFIDNEFCCRIELLIDSKNPLIPNPYSFCEMTLLPKQVHCFFPIKFAYSNFFYNKIFPLVGKVYQKISGNCNQSNPLKLYSVSPALSISFSTHLPVIWKLSDDSFSTILLGIPLHSVNVEENLLIPIRLLTNRADLTNQIICIQCVLDHNLYYHSVVTNSPNVSMISNNIFSDHDFSILNFKLKVTPGLDQQLMFLNVTVILDSRIVNTINSIKLQCCNISKNVSQREEVVCKDTGFVEIPLQQKSMMIIPVVNDSIDQFSIYSKPNISSQLNFIKVYGITNYHDKTMTDITFKVSIYPVDSMFPTLPNQKKKLVDIDMKFQTFLNPWSIQLQFLKTVHTLISPIRVWRPDSWKLILSDDILRPIKNWLVPQSDNAICVPRYKVARLKILCRLYLVEETGEKRYIGKEDDKNQIPFIDVTSMTSFDQLTITPGDIFSIQKSLDQDSFLISANQANKHSVIELFSMGSQISLASVPISADQQDIYVVDLILHCIDALSLTQQNRSIRSINSPTDHRSITVSLTSNLPSRPCYLVVFVVFSDNSIERISSVNINQYRLFITKSDTDNVIVKDSQLVTVRHMPHINMSLYEPLSCRNSRLIFTKKIEWVTVESANNIIPVISPSSTTQTTTQRNKTKSPLINEISISSINLVHILIYICTGVVALVFIGCILFKLICYRNGNDGSPDNGGISTNYQRSGSGFLEDSNIKVPIRTSNSKNFSTLSKCSTNCLRQNANKSHNNEPYPPLLPPPGPIAANYDLTMSDPVCNDSAIDSGVELGKLSSYSSNTCPSNDLCCTVDLYPSCSGTDDSLMHQQYQAPHFTNPMVGFYPQKGILESDSQYRDSMVLSSLNSTKTISNLRHPYW